MFDQNTKLPSIRSSENIETPVYQTSAAQTEVPTLIREYTDKFNSRKAA